MTWLNEILHSACSISAASIAKAEALNCAEFWMYRYQTFLTGTSASLIALFAAILAWRASRRQLGQAAELASRQLRAWVSAQPSFGVSFRQGAAPGARFTIRNLGNAVATELRWRADVVIAEHPLPPNIALPKLEGVQWTSPIALFPNDPLFGEVRGRQVATVEEIAAIRARTKAIYIYGELFYNDGYQMEPRETHFCSFISGKTDQLRHLTNNYKAEDLKLTFTKVSDKNFAT